LRLERWQSFLLSTPFGWVYPEEIIEHGAVKAVAGQRRYRTIYVETPRKNAKTTTAAGVGLYMLQDDGEEGGEVYSSATTRDQAKIVFDVARQMAMRSPVQLGLLARVHYLADVRSASIMRPLHAQGETLDGYNISCAINDELHAWKNRSVYDVIETATGARRQPIIFNITTAGDNLGGICYDIRSYCRRVLSGATRDDSFFGMIYTIDDEDRDNWLDPAVWRKANPNWGVSVYPMDMEALARKARDLATEQNAFLTKRLNVWTNAAVAWMDLVAWARCADHKMRIEDFAGEECVVGIDLASRIDVNSMAILFSRLINGEAHYFCFMRHWLPEAAVSTDRFGQYDGWCRMGLITKTPGNVIDVDQIEKATVELNELTRVSQLGVDPGHNSTQYGVHMVQQGFMVVDVRPTVLNFSEPMKWLEAFVKAGRFHYNCPVLTWMVSNVSAKMRGGDNIFPVKEAAERKIDGAIALLIALNRMMAGDQDVPVAGIVRAV
jgi:phage terminase large subunit-like protein